MVDFLIGFIRGIAAMSPIWLVLFFIFSNIGKKKVNSSVSLKKYLPEKDKTYLQ